MKRIFKNISKIAKKVDISPFSQGGIIKLIIYFTWGLNASMFMLKDLHAAQDYAGEQIIIEQRISHDEFICDCVSSEIVAEKISQLGSVYEHELQVTSFHSQQVFSNRAPPLS
jgi:hypothetical protein